MVRESNLDKNKDRLVLVNSSAHFDVEQKPYREKIGDERRASVAQQGERNTSDGKQADGHANIENDVKRDRTDEPEGKKKTKTISGSKSNI